MQEISHYTLSVVISVVSSLTFFSIYTTHANRRVVDGSKVIFFAITVRPKSDTM